jgi:crotonobetainyl-CoA:carnitine CoA-transferase CaiB-like acyl-CoA transferase
VTGIEGMMGKAGGGASARVLELGRGLATAWAGRLLADGGAEVLKVEPPDGDALRHRGPYAGEPGPDRSALFVAANVNKRNTVLDVASAAGRARLEHLLGWAEIVILDHAPDEAQTLELDGRSLAARHPELVALSITPFGIAGPRARWQATELILANAGGWANLCPNTHTDPALPPLKVYGEQSAFLSGTCGALVALAAWRESRRSGIGEFIDFSTQAYVASVLEGAIPALGYKEFIVRRYHPRTAIPWGIFQAKDGPVFLVCIEQDQWERLVEMMGRPDWATLEVFADALGRRDNQDLLQGFMQEFIAERTVAEFVTAAQRHRVCAAPVFDYAGLAHDPHLAARHFFQSYADPAGNALTLMANPILTRSGRAAIRHPAPRLCDGGVPRDEELPARERVESRDARLPLAGIRVIDLSWAWAGPFCATQLAHLGADVIRVESAQRPDLYRRLALHPDEVEPTLNTGGMFNQWHPGKRSIAVALRTPAGAELVRRLVARADVVVQNFGTGVLERLGLGYEQLRALNPRIILASVSGYGQTGPCCEYMGYGPSAAALSGLCSVTGYVGGGPEELGISMPDPTAGITAALAVVQALVRRDVTDEGDHLDIALWEATAVHGLEAWLQWQVTGTQPERNGNRATNMAPHGCYRCLAEDEWVAIACRCDEEWERLAAHIAPDLAADPRFATLAGRKRHEDALDQRIAAWTALRGRWMATRELQALGIPAFPSLSSRDVIDDAHLNARGFIERLAHPEVGARPHTGIPWRFERRPNGLRGPAPCLGADTDAVLREILDLDADAIAALRRSGALE